MRIIRTIIFYILLVLSFFVGSAIAALTSIFDTQAVRAVKFQNIAHNWAKFMAIVSGIPSKIYGLENLPKNETLILASNHQGAADILILLARIPVRFTFIVKKELLAVPFFGWYLKKAGYVGVDRGSRRGAVEMFSQALKRLKEGDNILIFPEGTRSPDGMLQEFKRGSLLLAFKAGIRVLPIAITGSFDIMPKKSYILNPVPVKIKIGMPMSLGKYNNDSNSASEDLHKIIQEMLLELQK